MKKLYFEYDMRISYSEAAQSCRYTMKCIPAGTDRQRLEKLDIRIQPKADYAEGEDSFGNRLLFGGVDEVHDFFSVCVTGQVTAGLSGAEPVRRGTDAMLYRHPHGLTRPAEGICSYWETLRTKLRGTPLEQGIFLMHRLRQDFAYEQNVTDISTTAEEAFRLGRGVCQDYAHILIALCRMAGIPARYVTGMLIGEGRSHAWVEILSEDQWFGLDPANDLLVEDSHIKIGVGRDAADCAINRGLVMGGGRQTQTVRVHVSETCEGKS